MKRFVSIFLCIIFITGCNFYKENPNTINVWHWMTDRHTAFEELAEKYENQTGIKVKFELFAPSEAYSEKITVSAQARILPDIFGILDDKKTIAAFVKNGFVADLTEEFQKNDAEWQKSLLTKAIETNQFPENNMYAIKPGIYGVPLDVNNIQMLYNKKLLAKAGIKQAPETFEDLLEAIKALNLVGISGFVSGWGELWLIKCFSSNYAFNIMGAEKVMATYRGEVPYTDPDWIKVLDVFRILRDHNAFLEGIVIKNNKEAEQDFAYERAAFAFNGSWSVNVYYDMNKNLDYGVILPPALNSEHPMKIWGGAGSSFVINNNSSKKDKAVAFLKWLTAPEQQSVLSAKTKTLPSNRTALTKIPDSLSEFAARMDQTTHPMIWPYTENPLVMEKFLRGIQAIIIGKKTPEEVASEVQETKIKEMNRAMKRKN